MQGRFYLAAHARGFPPHLRVVVVTAAAAAAAATAPPERQQARLVLVARGVAVQVAFESKVLKPGNHLIGSGLKPGAFKLWVNWIQLALPHRGVHGVERHKLHVKEQSS
jgi:hypothetical protein